MTKSETFETKNPSFFITLGTTTQMPTLAREKQAGLTEGIKRFILNY